MSNNNYMVCWAVGSGRNFAKAQNKTGKWSQFCKLLSEPTVTGERRKTFDKMSKAEQDALKSVDGWVSGAQCEGKWRNKANVLPRDLITLDIDYAEFFLPELIETQKTPLSGYEFVTHSSRRHTEEKPRLRIILPSARLISKEEYGPLVRIVSWMLDNEQNPVRQVDKVSARVAQMMFWPTRSKDGDWFYHRNEGELINPDDIFGYYEKKVGDWRDLSKLPLYEGEDSLREGSVKAEDPTTKKGPVGDFCRAYEVEAAMEKFLQGLYIESDEASGKPRYTYGGSTSSNGAVVEDGGLFLYSHHGSDPVCEQLVNAFDLVRIHLFGEKDQDIPMDTPMAQRPSWKAMMDHIKDDELYKHAQAEAQYDMVAMFEDVDDDYFEDDDPDRINDILGDIETEEDEWDLSDVLGDIKPAPTKKKRKAPKPSEWFPSALELDQHGKIRGTLHNAAVIIHNDFRLFGAIAFNDLSKQIVAKRSIRSHVETVPEYLCRNTEDGDRWQDINDVSIRALLEAPNGEGKAGYGMKVSDRDLVGGVLLAARRNAFHPVKDYLDDLLWDGKPRIETMLLRYMECEDSPYIREVSQIIMIASVVRIYEPGHKFDSAPIIEGPQGSRKSSFIKILYGESWFGEIDSKLDNKQQIAETLLGRWVAELPELSALKKSDHNDAKMFMRRQHDDVRMAYDRRVSEYPRQCVFWGSTNDDKYLKDPTGNRSYWPVDSTKKTKRNPIDTDALSEERDQLWAEAVVIYKQMRKEKPKGDLFLDLSPEASKIAETLQEKARQPELAEDWAERITDWADTPLSLQELLIQYGQEVSAFKKGNPVFKDKDLSKIMVKRNVWRQEHALIHALSLEATIKQHSHKHTINKTYGFMSGWQKAGKSVVKRFGKEANWRERLDCSHEDRIRGFSIALEDNLESNDDTDVGGNIL